VLDAAVAEANKRAVKRGLVPVGEESPMPANKRVGREISPQDQGTEKQADAREVASVEEVTQKAQSAVHDISRRREAILEGDSIASLAFA